MTTLLPLNSGANISRPAFEWYAFEAYGFNYYISISVDAVCYVGV